MGNSVVSVGLRHVKVWRIEQTERASPTKGRIDAIIGHDVSPSSPVPKALSGRNCLLGPLMEANFTSVVGVSQDKSILW